MIHDAASRTAVITIPPIPPLAQERNGYWFPMLLFGLLTLAAPLVYQPGSASAEYVWNPSFDGAQHVAGLAFAPLQQFGTYDAALGDPMSVALYWFCAVMFGPLIILLWYQSRARRSGVAPQTGWHLFYASTSLALYVVLFPVIEFIVLRMPEHDDSPLTPGDVLLADLLTLGGFVAGLAIAAAAAVPRRFGRRLSTARWTVCGIGILMAIASAAAIEFVAYLQPKNSYGALLIIAVGLLALSLVERGTACAVFAVVFTAAALAVNLVGLRSEAQWLGLVGEHTSPVGTAFANLVLPAAILLAGGLFGVARAVAARHRPVRGAG
jgi:hypothetical protein